MGSILPDGIGLNLVLSIKASVPLSCQWFNAEDAQAKRNIPPIAANKVKVISFAPRIYPSPVVNETSTVILNFISSENILNAADSFIFGLTISIVCMLNLFKYILLIPNMLPRPLGRGINILRIAALAAI
jgi:hypothetical protein